MFPSGCLDTIQPLVEYLVETDDRSDPSAAILDVGLSQGGAAERLHVSWL